MQECHLLAKPKSDFTVAIGRFMQVLRQAVIVVAIPIAELCVAILILELLVAIPIVELFVAILILELLVAAPIVELVVVKRVTRLPTTSCFLRTDVCIKPNILPRQAMGLGLLLSTLQVKSLLLH